MTAVNAVHAPPVVVSAPSVSGVAAVQLTVVAVVVPYLRTVCDAANCAYLKLTSMAVQPAPPTATSTIGSSPDESSLNALPLLQKFEPTTVAVALHHCTRKSPSTKSGGPANDAKSVK